MWAIINFPEEFNDNHKYSTIIVSHQAEALKNRNQAYMLKN